MTKIREVNEQQINAALQALENEIKAINSVSEVIDAELIAMINSSSGERKTNLIKVLKRDRDAINKLIKQKDTILQGN